MTYDDLKKQIADSGRNYDMQVIDRAYEIAMKSHAGQKRKSGEEFLIHPLHVASFLVELGMDTESLAAALLHDVVEDTSVTLQELEKEFGQEITNLVDGVTKLGRIPFSSVEEQQAENLRKLLLAFVQDIRVMIIKLCDRRHNLQTLTYLDEQKRRDVALETMEVYAPIAHRLGMNNFKEELEDLSLAYLDPIGLAEIEETLKTIDRNSDMIRRNTVAIEKRLTEIGINEPLIESRIKSSYGIYRKLYIQDRSVAEIYDIYAIRVIVDTISDCYNALGVLHDLYRPIPQRFKDYISTPKPNGYQSLHTTVVGREGIPFEVQIRTHEMHFNAEYGIAAHWKYKLGISKSDKFEKRLSWVRQLLESQKESGDSIDILRDIKSDLIPEEVFVFTPKGDVINLPAGSTVIDFAYAIHSAVGNRMIGAKVGGRIVPITYKVKTGEFIEVLTGPADKGPSRDWLKIVQTSEAKSKIRAWFKKERREENITEGKAQFHRDLRRNLINLPADEEASFVEDIAKRMRFNTADELYAALGYGGLQMVRIMPKVREEYKKRYRQDDPRTSIVVPEVQTKQSKGTVEVEGLKHCLVRFARCCNPLPGDEIVGFVTRGQGVSVHKSDCRNASGAKLASADFGRWVNVKWMDTVPKNSFKATLEIMALDRTGLLADLTTAISNMKLSIYSMNVRTTSDKRVFVSATIEITNTEHLKTVMQKLNKVRDVQTVERLLK